MLHTNTIRAWLKAIRSEGDSARLFTVPSWNRIHDSIRWTVRELRRVCPEPEVGSRSIAAMIVRTGVQISRSSVQRVFREKNRPSPAKPPLVSPAGKRSDYLLAPTAINRVWRLDLTTLELLFLRVTIAAVIDGFSRKLLALRLFAKTPKSIQLSPMVGRLARKHGTPRFLVTDHGGQFQKAFRRRISALGTGHVLCRVRCPALNGKIERFFRTLKVWLHATLKPRNLQTLQRRLDNYRDWYNNVRSHASLGGFTPQEKWNGVKPPEPIPIREADPIDVTAAVRRKAFAGDPRLPVIDVDIGITPRKAE